VVLGWVLIVTNFMTFKFKNNNNNKGIGLIEVIIALGVATVVTTSLVALSIFTLRASLKSKLIIEGTKAANKEMEIIRAYRDQTTWSVFTSKMYNGTPNCKTPSGATAPLCHMNVSPGSVGNPDILSVVTGGPIPAIASLAPSAVSTGFYVLSDSTPTLIKVNVVIQWNEGSILKKTTLRADFTNWQNK